MIPPKQGHCLRPGLGCFIILWIVIATVSLVLSYTIALSNGHILPYVPAISDTTSRNPEGAIFAEFFNITAFLTVVIVVVRYFQVRMLNRQVEGGHSSKLSQLNFLSIVFGVSSAFGATIVANFRSYELIDAIEIIHVIGSAILFIGSVAYCWTQTATTFQLTKFNLNVKPLYCARLVISVLLTIATLVFLLSWVVAFALYGNDSLPGKPNHLKPEDQGFAVYTVGNVAEWMAAWCVGLFGLSFFKEFQKLSLSVQCIPRCSGVSSDALRYSTIPGTGDEDNTDSD